MARRGFRPGSRGRAFLLLAAAALFAAAGIAGLLRGTGSSRWPRGAIACTAAAAFLVLQAVKDLRAARRRTAEPPADPAGDAVVFPPHPRRRRGFLLGAVALAALGVVLLGVGVRLHLLSGEPLSSFLAETRGLFPLGFLGCALALLPPALDDTPRAVLAPDRVFLSPLPHVFQGSLTASGSHLGQTITLAPVRQGPVLLRREEITGARTVGSAVLLTLRDGSTHRVPVRGAVPKEREEEYRGALLALASGAEAE